MRTFRWIVLLAIGALVLASCAVPSEATAPPACSATERCRGWVLFKVPEPSAAAGEIDRLRRGGGDDYVVIRTDVVRGTYNLIVPVDAANLAKFEEVLGMLEEIAGSEPVVLFVDEHYPAKTTSSNSFVTEFEREGYETDFPKPGRQVPNSPGANPWG